MDRNKAKRKPADKRFAQKNRPKAVRNRVWGPGAEKIGDQPASMELGWGGSQHFKKPREETSQEKRIELAVLTLTNRHQKRKKNGKKPVEKGHSRELKLGNLRSSPPRWRDRIS